MNDTLFKQLATELSPAEEAEFARQLATAYREHEAGERRPEVVRIAELVRKRLGQVATIGPEAHPDHPEGSEPPREVAQ
jgi:hypothetical protein